MFISLAYAQDAGGGSDMFVSFLPLVLIFVVFYFLLIRPQQKRAKDHKAMIAAAPVAAAMSPNRNCISRSAGTPRRLIR